MVILTCILDDGTSQIIDLYGTEKVAMNYMFTDPGRLSTDGSYSQVFRIPGTDRNLSFFGLLSNPNVITDFSFHKKVKASLSVDTIPVSVGHVQVLKAYRTSNGYTEIEINFYAETPDLTREIGSKMLSDIDYSSLDHDMTFENVTTGDGIDRWKYAVIDRGYKFSEQGEVGVRPIVSTINPIYPSEMSLMIREFWLFDKILTEAGFSYELSDIQAEMEAVYIPFVNSKWNKSTTTPAQFLFSAYRTSSLSVAAGAESVVTSLTETLDPNSDFDPTTGIYTAPFTGYFTFRLWATNDPTASSGIASNYRRMRLVDNTTNTALYSQMSTPQNGTLTKNIQSNDVILFLETGQEIVMKVYNQAAGSFLGGSDINTGTGWSLVNTSDGLAGLPMNIAANAPNVRQIDFILDVLKKYNLVCIPNRNIPKLIKFQPFVSYIGSGNTLDWTSKIDNNKDIVISPTTDYQKKQLTFTYAKGNDAGSEIFNKEGKRIYGDYKIQGYTIDPTDHANDFAQGEETISLIAQSTPCNTVNGTSTVIPKFVDASGEFVDPGLRYLYPSASTNMFAIYNEVSGDGELVTGINCPNHYSVTNADLNDDDLNFAPETPLHIITSNPFNNLFNKYYRSYLNEIYSPSARRMQCHMNLDINDVVSFQFSDRIFIIDSWWRLLSISNFEIGQNESVQCEFVKLIDSQLDCDSTPYQITTAGIVQFQLPDETLTFGTEDCCNRYGYNWSEDDSRCYAFGAGTGERPDRPNGVTTDIDGASQGLSFDSNLGANRYTFQMVNKSDISPDTLFSVIAGSDITIEDGNEHAFVAGEKLYLKADKRGAAVIGKNTRAMHGGLHMGGGWYDNDYSKPDAQSQYGVIQYIGEGSFTNTSTEIPILIEGYEHLNIEEGSALNCVLVVSLMKWNVATGKIDDTRSSSFAFTAYKVDGEAKKSSVHTNYDFGGLHAVSLEIDTTTNVNEHRLSLTMGGGGHPHTNMKIAASLIYTQIKE